MAKADKYPQFKGLNLTERQAMFVYWYCHPDMNWNGTRAYAKAYGLEDVDDYETAASGACRQLKKIKIMDAVDIERNRRLSNHEELANTIIKEWGKIATADVTDMLNIAGPIVMVKDLSELPQHLRSCIKSIKTTSNGVELTLHDKNKALENLGKTLGMFVERTQSVNEDYETLVEKIERKRREKKC